MIEIKGKAYRNLEEQVGYLTDRIQDGVDVVKKVVKKIEGLPLPSTAAFKVGETIAVGTMSPYTYYTVVNNVNNQKIWLNLGTFPQAGPQGIQGTPGRDGIDGIDGEDGRDGLDGEMTAWVLGYDGTNITHEGLPQTFQQVYEKCWQTAYFVYLAYQDRLYIPAYLSTNEITFVYASANNTNGVVNKISFKRVGNSATYSELTSENAGNKTSVLNGGSTNTQYPTAKATFDLIDRVRSDGLSAIGLLNTAVGMINDQLDEQNITLTAHTTALNNTLDMVVTFDDDTTQTYKVVVKA